MSAFRWSALSVVSTSVLVTVLAGGCNAKVVTVLGNGLDGDAVTEGADASAGLPDLDRPLVPASKVDVLFVVDNSSSMADKSSRLASSVGTLLRDVATTGDVHVGVISTSLGNFGGDVCVGTNPENNGHAYLRRTGLDGYVVPGAETGVLAYSGGNSDVFVSSAEALVRGVDQTGCGLEAQLEAMYRFLVQPDPWREVKLDGFQQADLGSDVDTELLVQRKAFLRPDSALVVVMLTDEDDSAVDPLAMGGQGWAFMNKTFPGSKVVRGDANQGTTAPRGTTACNTNPGSEDCTTCGFKTAITTNDPNCKESGVPGRQGDGYDGFYPATDDALNVRFHRMKARYGVDPQYPISRYVDGLTRSVVPNRNAEHVTTVANTNRRNISPYTGTPNCTNPIFAAQLPSSADDELCTLERGPRSRELVLFAVLGGVPQELATGTPDWTKVLGQDPDKYNLAGIDPHMIQSTLPRPGLPGPNATPTDPIHGREWDTNNVDLQYACTFELPTPRQCTANEPSCDCRPDTDTAWNPPLCGTDPTQQVRGKAYPTPRPLRVVRGLGERGVMGSVCAPSYDGTMTSINQRLVTRLAR